MDITSFLQAFENAMASYSGADPLEQWDQCVDLLEKRIPADGGMSVVLDRLVESFLDVPQYANDVRYVNYCIRCAGYYSNPVALFSRIFRSGVGTRTAAPYVAWAQHFEQRGMNEQAEAVYQEAVENQAQPADTVLHEYRQFQSRNRGQTPGSGVVLQGCQLTKQLPEPAAQLQASADCVPRQPQYVTVVSRSETSGTIPSSSKSGIPTVSEYNKDDLVCEGSELSIEEVRAQKYFRKCQEKDLRNNVLPKEERELREPKEGGWRFTPALVNIEDDMKVFGLAIPQLLPVIPATKWTQQNWAALTEPGSASSAPAQQQHRTGPDDTASHRPPVVPDRSLRLPLTSVSVCQTQTVSQEAQRPPGSTTEPGVVQLQEPEDKAEVSLGGTANASHVTPNNSLGFVQATPSRVLPSPTVNTREALDVIMDMFQAPNLLVDPLSDTFGAAEEEAEAGLAQGGATTFSKAPTTRAFTIFQDEDDKENRAAAAAAAAAPPAVGRLRASRPLAVVPVSKPNDSAPDLLPDEIMCGARYNALSYLAASPTSTTEFAMLTRSHFVSTPFTHKNCCQDQENNRDGGDAEAFTRRQDKKLSPIIEQSPSEEKLSETGISQLVPTSARHGTIVGEGVCSAQYCLTTSSMATVLPAPPALLSFRDQTLCPSESSASRTTGPSCEVHASPEQTPLISQASEVLKGLAEPGRPDEAPKAAHDDPMSPERGVHALAFSGPEAFLSPRHPSVTDVPMSPEQPRLCADVSMGKAQFSSVDEPMMSPDRGPRPSVDVSMKTGGVQLVPNPWDDELISDLLSTLRPPLTSHPRCITWQCNLPSISPKTTLSMGNASLRVDGVLGKGAFATVFQATDPVTSEKVVLKVQKPANPWEFYIDTQLDARLQPGVRHLYSNVRSAHLFSNGSVLLGELHSYGTLLNVVNMYKSQHDKVMPQPLVMYFTACILHMVEQLHSVGIIHADIKPDNFLLGDSFMENKGFDPEDVNHGLVLIDLGQSIDMKLFSDSTAFTARCRTSGFQCTEMLSGRPWSYQTDYFGLAGTVHCLLFGTYMQVRNEGGAWRTDGVFRRNPHGDLWLDVFHALLNVPDCSSRPSLCSLRSRLTSVLQRSYGSKLSSLKSRLVVLLLENRRAARK